MRTHTQKTSMTTTDFLYHGSPFPSVIQGSGVLKCAPLGYTCVSLTRSHNVARYFASLKRDEHPEEPRAGIFVFSRPALIQNGFEPKPFHDPLFGDYAANEEEEQVWKDIPLIPELLVRVDLIERDPDITLPLAG